MHGLVYACLTLHLQLIQQLKGTEVVGLNLIVGGKHENV